MSKRKIKPCPFCGQSHVKIMGTEGLTSIWLQCEECLASGAAYDSEAFAIAAWNMRASNE